MSSWETQATTSSFDAQSALDTHMGARNRDTSKTSGLNFGGYNQGYSHSTLGTIGQAVGGPVGGYLGDLIGGGPKISGYDMVGIVGSKVESMRDSIRQYVDKVQEKVSQAIEDAEDGMNDAFRGNEAQSAVKEYLEKVKLYINNLITQLISFSDKLADVGNAWQKAQEEIGGNVKTATGSFSEGTAYSESVTYTQR